MNPGFRHGMHAAILTCALALAILLTSTHKASGQVTITGTVADKASGVTLPGAHIIAKGLPLKAITDSKGHFSLGPFRQGGITLMVSFMGYKTSQHRLSIGNDTTLLIEMEGAALLGEEVNIIATRAQERYPTPFVSISREEIKKVNLGKDIPFLIEQSPSVIVTSDAGNGIGYSGINIRGTDLTRINVTVNGIPLNDAESQGVWFVDLPDIASSTADIQIQRGVGTSTNGAGAFGASINFMTSDLHQDAYGELGISGGTFNTMKSTLRFGTGLLPGKLSIDGRLSFIRSDGYIDRADANLKSYYFSGGYYGARTTLKFITFSGLEKTYQAWNGVPKDSLGSNRTYNPAGEYTDKNGNLAYYDNQTDLYQQDHYQLIWSGRLAEKLTLNTALHYTRGKGYYENYKEKQHLTDYQLPDVIVGGDTITKTNLINRKMLDNHFTGITFSGVYSIPEKIQIILGGAWNRYHGKHIGKVIWAEWMSANDNDHDWYFNEGFKYDFNVYSKANYRIGKQFSLFADLQYRRVEYRMEGILDNLLPIDQQHHFDFFNPKAGLFLSLPDHHELFISFGIANREPSRNNYKDADPGRTPAHETLYDYELGYAWKNGWLSTTVNGYFMKYKNQLVLTGEINNVGEAIMVNVPDSYRAGIELTGSASVIREKLDVSLSATISRNKIENLIHYIDQFDGDWNYLGQKAIESGTTDLAFSPSVLGSGMITYKPAKGLAFSLQSKYVSSRYIDNTSHQDRMLKEYFVHGFIGTYTFRTRMFSEIGLNISVNNIFSTRYETNAWVYPYLMDGQYGEYNGYFPQALLHFLAGLTLKL